MEHIKAFRTYGGTICTDEKVAKSTEAKELMKDQLIGLLDSSLRDMEIPSVENVVNLLSDDLVSHLEYRKDFYITNLQDL